MGEELERDERREEGAIADSDAMAGTEGEISDLG